MGVGAARGGVTATVGPLLKVKIIQNPRRHYIAGPTGTYKRQYMNCIQHPPVLGRGESISSSHIHDHVTQGKESLVAQRFREEIC